MWPLASDECYISIDIEADGPIPGWKARNASPTGTSI